MIETIREKRLQTYLHLSGNHQIVTALEENWPGAMYNAFLDYIMQIPSNRANKMAIFKATFSNLWSVPSFFPAPEF